MATSQVGAHTGPVLHALVRLFYGPLARPVQDRLPSMLWLGNQHTPLRPIGPPSAEGEGSGEAGEGQGSEGGSPGEGGISRTQARRQSGLLNC